MIKKILAVTAALALSAALVAHAQTTAGSSEDAVKKAVESKVGAKVENIRKSGYLNLYEIYTDDGQLFYTDEKVSVLLLGTLIDTKSKKNISAERLQKLTAVKFSDLPLERAIKQVRGDGKRVIASFEDPHCGYCKRLAKELQKIDNVTIYTFLLPILSEDSGKKSRQIWCSSDRAKSWNEWMLEGKEPTGKEDCDVSAIAKNAEYASKLKINGTPALFFASGERVPGYMPADRLEQKLNQGASN